MSFVITIIAWAIAGAGMRAIFSNKEMAMWLKIVLFLGLCFLVLLGGALLGVNVRAGARM